LIRAGVAGIGVVELCYKVFRQGIIRALANFGCRQFPSFPVFCVSTCYGCYMKCHNGYNECFESYKTYSGVLISIPK
jgi:hypothetical protein